jgi:hypothetical protein
MVAGLGDDRVRSVAGANEPRTNADAVIGRNRLAAASWQAMFMAVATSASAKTGTRICRYSSRQGRISAGA